MVLLKSQNKLSIGDQAIDFSLTSTDGKKYSLHNFKDKKGLLIIFMCNHCPYVIPKINTLVTLQEKFKDNLQIVGINPNAANPNYEDDSFENMIKAVEQQNINFIYLTDDTQEVAKSYGATCTPDPFLFDEDQKLFYHGQIDDVHGTEGTPTKNDMNEAIEALINGLQPPTNTSPSMGCSIKWV